MVAGGSHDTEACALPAMAVGFNAAGGGPAGVTALVTVDAGPSPFLLVAVIENV